MFKSIRSKSFIADPIELADSTLKDEIFSMLIGVHNLSTEDKNFSMDSLNISSEHDTYEVDNPMNMKVTQIFRE